LAQYERCKYGLGRHPSRAVVVAALFAGVLWTHAGATTALAASHHPRPATPPLHVRRSATPGYVEGYQPAQIRHAYRIDLLACGSDASCGAGQTIGIVDAYDDPTVE